MLEKKNVTINFSQGLDTKTDPWQVPLGKFLTLTNSIFTKGGLLQKRNGYQELSELPNISPTYLTTYSNDLTAIGDSLQTYSAGSATWVNKGNFQPISLSTIQVARSALNQAQCDSVTASNGLTCTVYTEVNNTTKLYKYTITDSTTGACIINPTAIPVASGAVSGSPRVFLLNNYFIVVFTNLISATSHLQFIAISSSSPTTVTTNADIVSTYTPPGSGTNLNWDGVSVPMAIGGPKLFIAFNSTSGGQHVGITYINSSLAVASPTSFSGSIATLMSVCADSNLVYASFYDSAGSTGYVIAVDQNLHKWMTATQIISSGTVYNIACIATAGIVTSVYEVANQYSYDSALASNYLNQVPVTIGSSGSGGAVGTTITGFIRSVGLASKPFSINNTYYVLTEYASTLQSTYFLIDFSGNVISRFAYENGGASLNTSFGYLNYGLPQAEVIDGTVSIAYLYKDLIESVSTNGLTPSIGPAGSSNIYTQTGINIASLRFSSITLSTSEIGSNLNLSGGLLWAYDGRTLAEQGFNVFPDNIEATWSASGGSIHAQPDGSTNTNAYYYQVIYEYTDARGNVIRSAPSVPIGVTTTSNGTSGSITVDIPTLRLTYKTTVKIVIYRWSVANQVYYQVTSLTAPTLNDKTTDSIAYVDTLADASIIGNSILYTTGGVVEDIAGPAATATTLFDDRLWLVDAEDQNLLWYSKQVIEGTPVEMSDLFTIYIAPTLGAQGSTGIVTALAPMDDKLIIFKKDAIYYMNGTGPDNTGANNQYSQPIFITSTVGCANQNSIVFMPEGLMFQSDKGIWLLGRDLSTSYIGAPVEQYNSYIVNSANNIPGTNQVRFTLSNGDVSPLNGVTLMYDYYYGQWGTFQNVQAISSTLYNSLHTYIDYLGNVLQETPGKYLDNTSPVLMSFTTSWLNLAGLQSYQRAFFFYILGKYITPHKLNLTIAYDYNPSPTQSVKISPVNFNPIYGTTDIGVYGNENPYGGVTNVEQWRVFLDRQRCTSFQIAVQEVYDGTLGIPAGAGLTLSGMNLVVGIKKGYRPQPAFTSTS